MVDPRFEGVEWLFFDWGGTLYDEVAAFRSMSALAVEAMSRHGVECDEEKFYARFLDTEFAGAEDKLGDSIAAFVEEPELQAAVREEAESRFVPQGLFPDAIEVLDRLSTVYKLGMISNIRPGLDRRLDESGLFNYFEVRVGSADVGVSKPDPAIFRLALEQAGCKPEAAIMIGDRPDNDIGGANAVGMRTIRIRPGLYVDRPVTEAMEPNAEIGNINELPALLL